MATIFTHPFVPLSFYIGLGKKVISNRLLLWAIVVTILPDIDVLAFNYGIPYESAFGHRGVTHSIVFALLIGFFGAVFFKYLQSTKLVAFIVLGISTLSHGLLDAMTNGGLGIAFFWPISNERFFLPWRPLEVSPIGVNGFFNADGVSIFLVELFWIILPLIVLSLSLCIARKVLKRRYEKCT